MKLTANSSALGKSFLFFFLLLSTQIHAFQSSQWLVENIQVDDGLPDTQIFSIQQDDAGFIWFGTTNGIARFDGYKFKSFKHDGSDPNTISHNNAGNIFIDSKNNLWIGTFGGGANKLNLNTGELTRFPYSNREIDKNISENVQTFFEDKQANIWIGTASGLYQLKDNAIKHYVNGDKNSLSHSRVWDILADNDSNIWIATSQGLSQLNPTTGKIKNFRLPEKLVVNIASNEFRTLFINDNKIWIGSSTGLYSFNISTNEFKAFSPKIKINDIYLIDNKHLLIASISGIYHFDLDTETFEENDEGEILQTLKNIDVRNIYLDKTEILWVATRDKGVIKIDQNGVLFEHHLDYSQKGKLNDKNSQVWSLAINSNQNTYIGTSDGLYKDATGLALIPGVFRDIKLSKNNGLWVASSTGLFFLSNNNEVQNITEPFDLVGMKSTDVFSVEETKSGDIWLALNNIGVLHWSPSKLTAQLIQDYEGGSLTDLNIGPIYQDSYGDIWFASYIVGLFKYHTSTQKIELFEHNYNDANSISSNSVNDIFQDSNNRIWVATSRGLNLYIPKTNGFKRYSQSDGLLENSIGSVLEDSQQNLWLSYQFGISRFNPQNNEITNYKLNNSKKFKGFIDRSAAIDKNDVLYYGSANGFYSFNPNAIQSSIDQTPILKLTNVSIDNKAITFNKLISNGNIYDLKHNDPMISFDIAALEYKNPQQVQYYYRVSNFQKNWNNITTSRHIELDNLAPGNYNLEIKATNNDGRWSQQNLNINIIVHPAWWNIKWVKTLLAISLLLLALALHYYRTYKIKHHNQLLETQVKNRTSELLSLNEKLVLSSKTDYLTGLLNRLGFLSELKINDFKQISSCIVLADIDIFKNINDQHGHAAGDIVLKNISKIMRSYLKNNDLLARWGGEEFIFYFENKDSDKTYQLIEELRKEIESTVTLFNGEKISITATFGICQRKDNMNLDDCNNAADKAMYMGKSKGRNITIISQV